MHIIIKKRNLTYDDYKVKCAVGKRGIGAKKREGDLITPKGKYKILKIFYRADRVTNLRSKISQIKIKKNMGWCDDIKSRKYNREICFPSKYSAEKLHIKKKNYDILINIKYNYSPTLKGKGSAIFLHLTNQKYKPTKGCIAIQKKDILKIIPLITRKTKILIK